MIAAQSKQADRKRIIEFLSRESKVPIDEVTHLYEDAFAALDFGARIKSFVQIFAIRNVQEALRIRSLTACSAGLLAAAPV